MGKAEVLAELASLRPEERAQVMERLCELQEDDLLRGEGPTQGEREMLDRELARFEKDGDVGVPWREALGRIRASGGTSDEPAGRP